VPTYTEMQSNIAALISRDNLTTSIQEAIKRAVRHYERETFYFNRGEDSFISSATAKQAYTISSTNTFLSVEQVVVNYSGSRYELKPENLETIKGLNAYNGLPRTWALEPNGNLITFDTLLNVTATVSYTYLKKYTSLSNAGDTNDFTNFASDLIEARACWWLYAVKIRNAQQAQIWSDIEGTELRQLKGETTMKQASGRVTPTKF